MDEIFASNASNYALTQNTGASVPLVVNVVLNPGLTTVTLTLSGATVSGNLLNISGVKDIAGNSMMNANMIF